MSTTTVLNETERRVIETAVERIAALRDRANTESHLLSITPTSRKHKADLAQAIAKLAGACDVAAAVVNDLTGSSYTAFGMEVRMTDFAVELGLGVIEPMTSPNRRADHYAVRDELVRRFVAEIVAP